MKITRALGNTSTMLGAFLLCAALTADGIIPVGEIGSHFVYVVVVGMIGMGYGLSTQGDKEL